MIDEIIKKHKGMKKPTDEEKLKRRKRYEDKQREIRRKRRIRKVVSTKVKRKKIPQVSACPECGDFHLKKSDQCKVRELKVKMIVQQIMKHSEIIKVKNHDRSYGRYLRATTFFAAGCLFVDF